MKILILEDMTFAMVSGNEPEIGVKYVLENATEGSLEQGRAFHALVMEYWKCGLWNYPSSGYRPGMTYKEFRDVIKRNLGAGFEAYFVAMVEGGKPKAAVFKKWEDVPEEIRRDPRKHEYCYGRLKSWGDYSMKERRSTIDNLIAEMDQVGVATPKYFEILAGMADNAKKGERT